MHDLGAATAAPQTDERHAWLAHADLLTGAGDPRGEAIRLELGDGASGLDPVALAAVHRDVERYLGLEELREDGSWVFTWRLGFIDEARFRLAPATRARRQDLVARLRAALPHAAAVDPADPADPEQWEGALIDALLSHPAARRLRALDLRLTDYHHSAEQAAVSLAAHPRPRLERLSFGYNFEDL